MREMIEVRTVSFGQFSGSYFTRRSFMSVMASVRDEVPRYTSYEGVGGWGGAGGVSGGKEEVEETGSGGG